jgi:hypothetical protein
VWIKAGEGDWHDPNFLVNVRRRERGLKVGAYHFLRPKAGRNGAQEAAYFIARLKEAGLGKGDLHARRSTSKRRRSTTRSREYAGRSSQAAARRLSSRASTRTRRSRNPKVGEDFGHAAVAGRLPDARADAAEAVDERTCAGSTRARAPCPASTATSTSTAPTI